MDQVNENKPSRPSTREHWMVVTSCSTARQEETDCEKQSGNALFGCNLDGGSM